MNNYDDCFLRENQYRDKLFEHLSSGSYKSFKHFEELNFDLLEMLESSYFLFDYHWIRQLGDQNIFDVYAPIIIEIFEISLQISIRGSLISDYEKYLQPQILKKFKRISNIDEILDFYDEILEARYMN